MNKREASLAIISSWVLEEKELHPELMPDDVHELQAQILDLSLLAAALLRCWADEAGIPPQVLLSDLALGQAIEENTSPTK